MLADLGECGHSLDQPVTHKGGMGSQKPDAVQIRDFVEFGQKLGQVGLFFQVIAVGVHGLAEDGHFLYAPGGQQLHLVDHFVEGAAYLASTAVGYDAECAHEVAAVDDGDVAGDAGLGRGQGADAALPVEAEAVAHQVEEGAVFLGPHEQVNEGEALGQIVGLGADHATHEGHDSIVPLFLERGGVLEVDHHLVFRVLTHNAGIEDYNIGI